MAAPTYLRQFEAAASANYWTENDIVVSLVLTLKRHALELLQNVTPNTTEQLCRIDKRFRIYYGMVIHIFVMCTAIS